MRTNSPTFFETAALSALWKIRHFNVSSNFPNQTNNIRPNALKCGNRTWRTRILKMMGQIKLYFDNDKQAGPGGPPSGLTLRLSVRTPGFIPFDLLSSTISITHVTIVCLLILLL